MSKHVYLEEHASFGTSAGTFADARRACSERGGHLATVNSAEELAFVLDAFPGERVRLGLEGASGGSWITGEEFDGSIFPSVTLDANQCGVLEPNGSIVDQECGFNGLPYLCEWD